MSRNARAVLTVVIAGCAISTLGFGIRATFGLFMEPLSAAREWPRETLALALALQNLLWGMAMPFAGAMADSRGPVRVIILGALMYAAGVYGMAQAQSGAAMYLTGGILTGVGVAFSSFPIALAAMARVVGEARRSFVLGIGTAAGSFGQVLFSPLSQYAISELGWYPALLILSSTALAMIPLALMLPRGAAQPAGAGAPQAQQSLRAALSEAAAHRGYLLLTVGFFVCGFHVAFIGVHFPAYIQDIGLAPETGALALALIGLMNIAGSFLSGLAGQRWSKKFGLSTIYFARTICIALLLLSPKTEFTIYLFAAAMGVLWLSTVPLTTGIVAQVFGVRYMATLFGVVFFSHQLGSFLGVWLGGRLHDQTGSYDAMWLAGIAAGLFAALVHLPINERPLPRLARAQAPAPAN